MSNGNGKINGKGPTGAPPKWLIRAPQLFEEKFLCREYFCDIDAEMKLRAPEDEVRLSDLLTPSFWSKNVKVFRDGDKIRCVREGLYDLTLIVTVVLQGGCIVEVEGELTRPGSAIHNRLVAAQKAARAAEHAEALAKMSPAVPS